MDGAETIHLNPTGFVAFKMKQIRVGRRRGREETCGEIHRRTTASADLGVSSNFFGENPKVGSVEGFEDNVDQSSVIRS